MRKIYIDCLSKYYRIALLEDGKLQEVVYTEKDEKASAVRWKRQDKEEHCGFGREYNA